MDRKIACLRIPAFEIELARLADPSLKGRPIAIATRRASRAVLHDVSQEGQEAGLYPGMLVELARRLCPAIRIVESSPARVRRGHQCLYSVINQFAPLWEPIAPGHAYLDLTGTHRLFGAAKDAAGRIERELVERHGLRGAAGVGTNKLVTHVAADLVSAASVQDVPPGEERRFLAPLPPTVLPAAGWTHWESLLAVLRDLNLNTLGAIADVSVAHLKLAVGRPGERLHRWALGVDHSPVRPPWRRSGLRISHTLEPDEVDRDRVLRILFGMVEAVCRELRRMSRFCRRVRLTVVHSDHVEAGGEQRLNEPSHWETDVYPVLAGLYERCGARRVRIRTLIVEAEALGPAARQMPLFGPTAGGLVRPSQEITLAVDQIRRRFGARAIRWGRTTAAAALPRHLAARIQGGEEAFATLPHPQYT